MLWSIIPNLQSWSIKIQICIATGAWLGSFRSVGIVRLNNFKLRLSQKSDHAPSHINLGSAFAVKERFDEACDALRRGVALDDSCNDAKFNLGLTLLTIGEFEEGWHFYDTRLRLPDKVRSPVNAPDVGWRSCQVLVINHFWFGLSRVMAIIFSLCVMFKSLIEAGVKVTFVSPQAFDAIVQGVFAASCSSNC